MSEMSLPIVRLSGSPANAGAAFAEFALANGAARALGERLAPLGEHFISNLEQALAAAELHRLLKTEASAQYAESAVLARALGVTPSALMCVSGLSDTTDWLAGDRPHECTCLLRRGKDALHWQTWDFANAMSPFLCVISRAIDGAYRSATLTTLFGHAHFGINSEGLAIGTQNLACTDARPGVPFAATIARVLDECANVRDARDLIASVTRMSGHRFTVSDQAGEIAVIETTATAIEDRMLATDETVIASNYPLYAPIAKHALDYSPQSHDRVRRMSGEVAAGHVSASYVPHQPVLRLSGKDVFETSTLAAISFCRRTGEMNVWRPESGWMSYEVPDAGRVGPSDTRPAYPGG